MSALGGVLYLISFTLPSPQTLEIRLLPIRNAIAFHRLLDGLVMYPQRKTMLCQVGQDGLHKYSLV